MIILGIETSCDETSASVVENGTLILSNVVASSQEMHIKTGGIIPEMAAREQIKCMIPVIEEAFQITDNEKQKTDTRKTDKTENLSSVIRPPNIDAIAVTVGPGLIGSLLVGVETAKTLAYLWHKPIIPVNHLLAHVYANWLNVQKTEDRKQKTDTRKTDKTENLSSVIRPPKFPLVALIVSGGHTELILMQNHGDYKILGGTRDDAAGECFDKIARLLDLGYPGGPAIAQAATRHAEFSSASVMIPETSSGQALNQVQDDKTHIKLPRPMIDSNDYDFSFSGLKTAVLREVTRHAELVSASDQKRTLNQVQDDKDFIYQLAYEVQEAITDVLVEKAVRAAKENNVKQILLSGGVAANDCLRQKFKVQSSKFKVKFFAPAKNLCTDNAAPIAGCAFFNYKPVPWQEIQTDPSLSL